MTEPGVNDGQGQGEGKMEEKGSFRCGEGDLVVAE